MALQDIRVLIYPHSAVLLAPKTVPLDVQVILAHLEHIAPAVVHPELSFQAGAVFVEHIATVVVLRFMGRHSAQM